MNDTTLIHSALRAAAPRGDWLARLGRKLLLRQLQQLHTGTLTLTEGATQHSFGHGLPQVQLSVHHPAFYADLAFGGSIGAGEAYMAGAWSCSDLTGLMRLMVLNQDVLDRMEGGPRRAAAQGPALAQPQQPRRQPAQHRRALRPRQRLLPPDAGRHHDVLLRHFRNPAQHLARGFNRQARRPLPQARPAAERPLAGDRHRLGRFRHPRGAALWLPGDDHHHLAQSI
jgi:hypothetical protein